jgi:hypothetical protein
MREYIDRECIYRVDDKHPPIPSKVPGGTYGWQFYLRRATFHPDFAYKLGLLFWDHFLPVFQQQPFQIAACIPSGPPIGMAIASVANILGLTLNVFVARREPKHFGVDNWFEGQVVELPVLILDDSAASANHMRLASARIQQKLQLPLHRNYFAIVNKVGVGVAKNVQHTENYLDNELITFFTLNNFCKTAQEFKDVYGHAPGWSGPIP